MAGEPDGMGPDPKSMSTLGLHAMILAHTKVSDVLPEISELADRVRHLTVAIRSIDDTRKLRAWLTREGGDRW